MPEQNRVQWVYSATNNQELADRYDQWAKEYDSELAQDFEWAAPAWTAQIFANHVAKDARILDAGAGTGLVGQELAPLGFANLVAMDLSPGMLNEARGKGVYREFHQMVMGDELTFPTNSFDAVISVGVLTLGHAPASSLDELARVTKTGGHIVFTLRPDVYEGNGFKEKQEALESEGLWRLVEVTDRLQVLPKGEPDAYHQVWVYQITD
jgi:SAM-dependent methyltransferase